eukprot:scaffold245335_cov32-Prasinocladus_malaysianus.AAC.3
MSPPSNTSPKPNTSGSNKRKRQKERAHSPLNDDDRLRSAFDLDEVSEESNGDDGKTAQESQAAAEKSPGAGASAAAAEERHSRRCCVKGCFRPNDLVHKSSFHKCRECGGFFHPICADKLFNSDDSGYCGCKSRPVQPSAGEQSEPTMDLPEGVDPPEAYSDEEKLAWQRGLNLADKTKKPPKTFSKALSNAWTAGRERRRRVLEAMRKKTYRANKGKEVQPLGHNADPEYRAAANTSAAKHRDPNHNLNVPHELLDIYPGLEPPVHRAAEKLKGWWADLKSTINLWRNDHSGPSGRNGDLPRSDFCRGDFKGCARYLLVAH